MEEISKSEIMPVILATILDYLGGEVELDANDIIQQTIEDKELIIKIMDGKVIVTLHEN